MSKDTTEFAVPRRACGFPKEGGLYILSQGEAGGVLPILTLLLPPVRYTGKHFRSASLVKGDALLAGEPEVVWAVGEPTSKAHADTLFKNMTEWDE